MFTGIVQGQATLVALSGNHTLKHFTFAFPEGALDKISVGASIALNGTCLTVTQFDLVKNTAQFDAIETTLNLTNLGLLTVNDKVNFERAAKVGDEIGGHLMSGHIFACIDIVDIQKTPVNCGLYFQLPASARPYIMNKGYIGLNGCSLTISSVERDRFSVHLIPETLQITTFGGAFIGQKVNLEIDSQTQAIVNTVEQVLREKRII